MLLEEVNGFLPLQPRAVTAWDREAGWACHLSRWDILRVRLAPGAFWNQPALQSSSSRPCVRVGVLSTAALGGGRKE